MKSFTKFSPQDCRAIRYVLCDMDDTLTLDGQLPAASYTALEDLSAAGLHCVVVTGRPGGWCDMMARFWPIAGVVGENGAFYFRYDHKSRKMIRKFQQDDTVRRKNMRNLEEIYAEAQSRFPGFAISADQAYRISDLAIDFCEDVPARSMDEVQALKALFEKAGATAKISSIHVNAWFGDFDKLSMSRAFFSDQFDVDLESVEREIIYVGDSPNDEPMFQFFSNSIGVANVAAFTDQMKHPPKWVTEAPGGHGFREISDHLLAHR